MLEQMPPRGIRLLINDVTSSVVGDPSDVWQVTPFWRVSRIGDPSMTGRVTTMALEMAHEKCIWYVCKCGFPASTTGLTFILDVP